MMELTGPWLGVSLIDLSPQGFLPALTLDSFLRWSGALLAIFVR
jgi:hypothetical protein